MRTIVASAALALALSTVVVPDALAGASRIPSGSRAPAGVLQQAEMSMIVTGALDIDAHGRVSAITLEPSRSLSDTLEDFVRQQVSSWQFEPGHEGDEVAAAAMPMRLKLVSRNDGNGGAVVRISSAHFGDDSSEPVEHRLTKKHLTPPRYPLDVFRMGGTGEVYLLLKIGPDGKVIDTAATRVNLTRAGNERTMERVRQRLAQAAVEASRGWEYNVPTAGPKAGEPYWLVRVPVNFEISDSRQAGRRDESQWRPYIPGPRLDVAWYQPAGKDNALAVEAMPEGEPMLEGQRNGPRLSTSLDG